MNKIPTVLFVTDVPYWAGSTLSLKDLLQTIKNEISPIVIFYEKGSVYDYMINQGIECYIVPYRFDYFKSHKWYAKHLKHAFYFFKHHLLMAKGGKMLMSMLHNRNVDIVHSNTSAVDFGYLIAKRMNAKHVWHIREMLELFTDVNIIGGVKSLKRKISKSDKQIFISTACRDFWGIDNENSVIIGDAVRSENDLVYIKEKKPYILFCCQELSYFKGADFAIKSFGLSVLPRLGYRLKLIGDCSNSFRMILDEIVETRGLKNCVDYLGTIDEQSIKKYFMEASAFLQPSKMEGLGRVTIEAMFYGCPVIARDCGGTLDFVINGVSGYLWSTEQQCVAYLNKVVEGIDERIIKKAQTIVAEKYCTESYGSKILDVYKKMN